MALAVKSPPADAGDARVQSLGWEDPLEEGMATPLQNSCLENPLGRGAGGPQSMGSQSVRQDCGAELPARLRKSLGRPESRLAPVSAPPPRELLSRLLPLCL